MRASDTVRALVAAASAAVVFSGWGSSSPQLAPIERNELHAFVERARSAAKARDLAATNAALEALQARVRALREAGRIDGEMAQRLLKYSAVTQLRARTTLRSEPPAAPAAEAESDPPAAPGAEPAPPAPPAAAANAGGGNDKGNDKNKDNDKDKGKDKDDGNRNGNGNGNGKAVE